MSRSARFMVAISSLLLLLFCTFPIHAEIDIDSLLAEIDIDSLLLESIGGQKALERFQTVQSVTISGTIDQNGMQGRFIQYYVATDKLFYTIEFPELSRTDGYDGQTAWRKDFTGKVTELKGAEKARLQKMLYFWSISYLIDGRIDGKVSYAGISKMDDKQYHQIDFDLPGSQHVSHLFGVESIRDQIHIDKLDNLEIITYRSEFKSIESILYPFQSTSFAKAAGIKIEIKIDSVILDGPVDKTIFNMPSENKTKEYQFFSSQDSVIVPFNYYQGHLYVEIEIEKGKRFWFILDTGASATMLSKSLFIDNSFEIVGRVPAKGVVNYEKVDLVKLDSLSIGDVVIYDLLAGLIDLPPGIGVPPTGLQLGGAIGYDFFSRFPILIDFENSLLTVYRESPPIVDSSQLIDFYLSMQIPTIKATVANNISGDFIIDIGNPFGILFHRPFVDNHRLDSLFIKEDSPKNELGGIGGLMLGTDVKIPQIQIGIHKLTRVPAIIPAASENNNGAAGSNDLAGNIGNMVLQNFRLLLEYSHSRIRLLPHKL